MEAREQKIKKIKQTRKRQVRITTGVLAVGLVLLLMTCFSFSDEKENNEQSKAPSEQVSAEVEGLEEPKVYVEPEIDIVMVGDVLLHDNVQESGKLSDGTYNYDHLFANVKEDIQVADIAIANQEVILGGKEIGLYGYPNFNGPYEVGDALAKAGFNVVLHATNHTLDRGKTALMNCMNFWKTNHSDVAVLGVFETQEAYDNDIYTFEQDGIKIAILNYTYGTNGMPTPSDMPFAVAKLEENKVISDLKKANEMADFLIVCPHWGTEYRHEQSKEQEYWAKIFMDNGVDLVIGTHPHYIQPVEMITNESGEQMLVYYSLGNFINSTAESGRGTADRMIGGMAQVKVAKKETGEVYIKEYAVEPLVTQLSYEPQQITTYKLSDYTEELSADNQIIKKDSAFSLQYCKELCGEVFGELF